MTTTGSILYIPHGGGPMPLLDDPGHARLNAFLTTVFQSIPTPEAVVVISAHWEMDIPVVTAHEQPDLIYDYYGFPRETYEISYPAPGHPVLAKKAVDLMTAAGIKARTDVRRGFDHGLFIPLTLMLPKAEIPCIQISLCADLDPLSHLKLGEAIGPLAKENVLILGSGFSFHNMGGFGRSSRPGQALDQNRDEDPDQDNQMFQNWLDETCTLKESEQKSVDQKSVDPKSVNQKERLIRWETAPGARHCHPREEHLLPLMVCAGAAGYRPAEKIFDDRIMDRRALSFFWKIP